MEIVRRFIREDLIELTCMMAGLMIGNHVAQRFSDRMDSSEIGFLLGLLGAAAGLLLGKWLQYRLRRWRGLNDDQPD